MITEEQQEIQALKAKIAHLEARIEEVNNHWKRLSHAIVRGACEACDVRITSIYAKLEMVEIGYDLEQKGGV